MRTIGVGPAWQWRARAVRAAAALIVLGVFFAPLLPPSVMLAGRDVFRLHLPVRYFVISEIKAGHFPTWFPLDGLGLPLMGPVGAVLDPFNLLLLVCSPETALKWKVIIEQGLAAYPMFLLARRVGALEPGCWVAALGYVMAGFFVAMQENPTYHSSVAALPWVVLGANEVGRDPSWRGASLLALATAFTWWCGDVQALCFQWFVAHVVIASFGASQWARKGVLVAASMSVCVALNAPAIGPTLQLARDSGRAAGLVMNQALLWSLHPARLAELIVGPLVPPGMSLRDGAVQEFIGGRGPSLFSASEYCGVLVVALAASSLLEKRHQRVRWLFGGLAVVFSCLAMGKWFGLYGLGFRFIPIWGAFRYPEKLMPFAILSVCLLASIVRPLCSRGSRFVFAGLAGVLAGAAMFISGDRIQAVSAWLRPDLGPIDASTAGDVSSLLCERCAVAALLLFTPLLLRRRRPSWVDWACVMGVVIQALGFSGAPFQVIDRAILEPTPLLVQAIRERDTEGGVRVCSWPAGPFEFTPLNHPSSLARELVAEVDALLPDHPARFGMGSLIAYQPGLSSGFVDACLNPPLCGTVCTRRMGARWLVLDPPLTALSRREHSLKRVMKVESPSLTMVEDIGARRLVSTPGVRFVPSQADVAGELRHSQYLTPEAVMVGNEPENAAQSGVLSFGRPMSSEIQAETNLSTSGIVVIAEQLTAGWSAKVDGVSANIEKADLILGAVRVGAGRHHLVLKYIPPGWPWVWVFYLLGWAVLVGVMLCRRSLDHAIG